MEIFRRSVAEAVGTGLLLATVIGSGIMGERLAGGNVAIALLANTSSSGWQPGGWPEPPLGNSHQSILISIVEREGAG